MSIKYWMLCISLFIIVLFLAIKSYDALTHPLNLTPDKGAAKKAEARTENSSAMGVVSKPASTVSYNFIAGKNIFSPERKDFQATGPGSAANPALRPQVILYGITIAGNYQSASLVSPGRSLRKGERDLMTLKLGERVGEYKLTKILSDRVTLEAQGDAFEVLLYDPKAPKKRGGGPPGAPSTAFTPTGTPGPFVRTEATKGAKGSAQERTSPSQVSSSVPTPIPGPASAPSQIPAPAPTPTQFPAPMSPTITSAPMVPTSVALPPDMGQPVSLPPGMGGQTVPVPSGMGQPIPLPPGVPMQPSSPGGR